MAIGFWTSGSAAKTVTRNPAGTRKPAAASAADNRPVADGSVSRGRGKSPPAARGDEVRARARRTAYENAVRFMLRPISMGGIAEKRSTSSLTDSVAAVTEVFTQTIWSDDRAR